MKSLAKKIVVGLMAGSLFFVGAGEICAAKNFPQGPPTQEQRQARLNDWAKATSKWSGVVEKDLLDAVKNHRSFEDIEIAAMLSKISNKPFKNILAMKTNWPDIMQKLGVTPEEYDKAYDDWTIKSLSEDTEISESVIKNLLEIFGKKLSPARYCDSRKTCEGKRQKYSRSFGYEKNKSALERRCRRIKTRKENF